MDGKEVTAEKGETILEVARRNDVYIPTLCHMQALEPAAMCRICTVELVERGRTRLVTSCNFPLRSSVEIRTDTPKIRQGRKIAIELLGARCPGAPVLKDLAERYGADLNRFQVDDKQCIMCGLCARVCERVGSNVLALCGRGAGITVDTFLGSISPDCIGCGACAQICPVNTIQMIDADGERRLVVHGKEVSRVPLRRCNTCGEFFGPVIDLNEVMERAGEAKVPAPNIHVCPICSRRNLAKRLVQRHFEQYELSQSEPL
jgi:bidirectional [NiFe] hydrogenase diaphorase subunit